MHVIISLLNDEKKDKKEEKNIFWQMASRIRTKYNKQLAGPEEYSLSSKVLILILQIYE